METPNEGPQHALQSLLAAVGGAGPQPTNEVAARLTEHLGPGADHMEILNEAVPAFEHLNLQAALDAYLNGPGRTHELSGVRGGESAGILGMPQAPHLEALLSHGASVSGVRFGSVDYVSRPSGPGRTEPCVQKGLFLIDDDGEPLALWVREEKFGNLAGTTVLQVVSADIEASRAFLAGIGALMRELNVYRGNVLALSADAGGQLSLSFSERFKAERDAVVLPPGVLEALEDQTIGIGEMRDRLLAAGRHLKRGLLLYGPPGTGKTHTIRYLTSRLEDYTVFSLTGSVMSALRTVGDLLPRVAPAVVVFDDVDLIAEDRERSGQSPRRFLFDLLDLMDGLREDLDVVFILTTNRVEAIESAIAARPGRVDLAVEIPVPDRAALRRLIDLYGEGIDLRLADADAVIDRLEGVTASFIRELLRRATLLAARQTEGSNDVVAVDDGHVHAALDRLLDPRSPLTSALLGRHEVPPGTASATDPGPGAEWCALA